MRLPKKSILIRLAIYVPLLAFFGWRALVHYQAEQEAARQVDSAEPGTTAPGEDPFKDLPTKTIDVDGKQIEVYEITPAQAEQYFGVPAEKAGQGEQTAEAEVGDGG